MSHYTLMTIGITENDIPEIMAEFDESKEVSPYIDLTKEQILEMGIQRIKEGRAPSSVTTPEGFYDYYTEGSMLDEDGNLLSTYNPKSKWDYYTIYSRLTATDAKKMYEKSIKEYDSSSDEMVWKIIVENDEKLKESLNPNEAFNMLWGAPNKEKMLEMYGTMSNYIEHCKKSFSLSYSVITPDGEWHEPGKVGWFGCSSATPEQERDWDENFYEQFIKDMPDDTEILLIDCHI